jgi:effector-binding domain-containing protein
VGPQIAEAMGSAFGEVFGFVGQAQIAPISKPMSVYLEMMDGPTMRFRGGVIVSEQDAAKASGNVKTCTLPAGEVMTTVHVGPYDGLGATHQAMWRHMEESGLACTMPVWEIYIDDPGDTDPASLRTEIYRAIG